MAFSNKIIFNPKTKQGLRFLRTSKETGGELLEMETTYHRQSTEPPPHYHPQQVEDFTVLKGELTVRIDGALQALKQGDKLRIPKNTVHSMWNSTNKKTVVNWKVQPALDTENFLETAIGLATDGKTNDDGMPGILQIALLANKYGTVFRLSKPHFAVQKLLFLFLTPFAFLFGYRPTYQKYLD